MKFFDFNGISMINSFNQISKSFLNIILDKCILYSFDIFDLKRVFQNQFHTTTLHLAVEKGNIEIIKSLLQNNKIDVNIEDEIKITF